MMTFMELVKYQAAGSEQGQLSIYRGPHRPYRKAFCMGTVKDDDFCDWDTKQMEAGWHLVDE